MFRDARMKTNEGRLQDPLSCKTASFILSDEPISVGKLVLIYRSIYRGCPIQVANCQMNWRNNGAPSNQQLARPGRRLLPKRASHLGGVCAGEMPSSTGKDGVAERRSTS